MTKTERALQRTTYQKSVSVYTGAQGRTSESEHESGGPERRDCGEEGAVVLSCGACRASLQLLISFLHVFQAEDFQRTSALRLLFYQLVDFPEAAWVNQTHLKHEHNCSPHEDRATQHHHPGDNHALSECAHCSSSTAQEPRPCSGHRTGLESSLSFLTPPSSDLNSHQHSALLVSEFGDSWLTQ